MSARIAAYGFALCCSLALARAPAIEVVSIKPALADMCNLPLLGTR